MKLNVEVKCQWCRETHYIVVDRNDYYSWKRGKMAQAAFPYLTPDEREMLISRTCGNCWNEIMSEGQ